MSNPRLAEQRATFFKQLDGDAAVKRLFIQAALAEGGVRGLLANFEQMMNYGNARGFHDASQIVHSGFYGPVNRGEAQRKRIFPSTMRAAETALQLVREGSNILDYRTDQGIPGDPNYDKEARNPRYRAKKIAGCFFADHPMFDHHGVSWQEEQHKADAAWAAAHTPTDAANKGDPHGGA